MCARGRAVLTGCLVLALIMGALLPCCLAESETDAPPENQVWRAESSVVPAGTQPTQQEEAGDISCVVDTCAICHVPASNPQVTDAAWHSVLYYLLPLGGQAPPACLCVFAKTA